MPLVEVLVRFESANMKGRRDLAFVDDERTRQGVETTSSVTFEGLSDDRGEPSP